jgi:hypothetical protein
VAKVVICFEDIETEEGSGVDLLADFIPMPERPVKAENLTNAQVLGAHLISAAKKLMASVVDAGDAKWREEIEVEEGSGGEGSAVN